MRPAAERRIQGSGREAMGKIGRFWRGELPLGQAFWSWGILGGVAVSAASTVLALTILNAGGPGWLALLAYLAHVPWNVVILVGVWRSAARADDASANLARMAIAVWALVLTLL
jgi:hypothetical protein